MWSTGQLHWPIIVTFFLSKLFVVALAAVSLGSTGACCGLCEGWACDKGGAPYDLIDAVAEVTVGVFLALSSFLSFFLAFFLALQFSVECLLFPQKVHFSFC